MGEYPPPSRSQPVPARPPCLPRSGAIADPEVVQPLAHQVCFVSDTNSPRLEYIHHAPYAPQGQGDKGCRWEAQPIDQGHIGGREIGSRARVGRENLGVVVWL